MIREDDMHGGDHPMTQEHHMTEHPSSRGRIIILGSRDIDGAASHDSIVQDLASRIRRGREHGVHPRAILDPIIVDAMALAGVPPEDYLDDPPDEESI